MATRIIGAKVIPSPHPPGIAVVPAVPFPATEAERNRAAREASKVAVLLSKLLPAQIALLRHLADTSPDGSYVVTAAKWIDTILKATKDLNTAEMAHLYSLDWTERATSPGDLRRELLSVLTAKGIRST